MRSATTAPHAGAEPTLAARGQGPSAAAICPGSKKPARVWLRGCAQRGVVLTVVADVRLLQQHAALERADRG